VDEDDVLRSTHRRSLRKASPGQSPSRIPDRPAKPPIFRQPDGLDVAACGTPYAGPALSVHDPSIWSSLTHSTARPTFAAPAFTIVSHAAPGSHRYRPPIRVFASGGGSDDPSSLVPALPYSHDWRGRIPKLRRLLKRAPRAVSLTDRTQYVVETP